MTRAPDAPRAVTLAQLADALGVDVRTVRHWAETDPPTLETWQRKPYGKRYVSLEEIAALERCGVPVDWDRLIDSA